MKDHIPTTLISTNAAADIGGAFRTAELGANRAASRLSDLLKFVTQEAQAMPQDKAKAFIASYLESVLRGASRVKQDIVDAEDVAGKEARKKIWANIRYNISNNEVLFVGDERPQAKQGSNWLVAWGLPQVKTTATATATASETSTATASAPVEPVTIQTTAAPSQPETLATIQALLQGLDLQGLQAVQKAVAAAIKATRAPISKAG